MHTVGSDTTMTMQLHELMMHHGAGCGVRARNKDATSGRGRKSAAKLVRSQCVSQQGSTCSLPPTLPAERRMSTPPSASLPSLLAPLPLRSFLAEHWERAPLLAHGAAHRFAALEQALRGAPAAARCVPAVDIDELNADAVLAEAAQAGAGGAALHGRDVRLVRCEAGAERFFCAAGEAVDAATLREAAVAGCTVALRAVNLRCSAAAAVAASLSDELGLPVAANLYVTPARQHGLAPHYDDHDVFALQLAGTKQWRVHAEACGAHLPRLFATRRAPQLDGAQPTTFTLTAGDVLYIPRGWPHSAAAQDGMSTHLTLAVEVPPPFEWAAALHVALRLAAGCSPRWSGEEALLHAAVRSLADAEASLRAACLGDLLLDDNGADAYVALLPQLSRVSLRDAREAALRYDACDSGFSWLAHLPCGEEQARWRARADAFYDALEGAADAGDASFARLQLAAAAQPWEAVRAALRTLRARYHDAHAAYGRHMRELHEHP